jgi:hypothetical protein
MPLLRILGVTSGIAVIIGENDQQSAIAVLALAATYPVYTLVRK